MTDQGIKSLAAMKRATIFENASACLSDIGDGALCFEHKTKMAIYDDDVFAAIGVALEETPSGHGTRAPGGALAGPTAGDA
jgi:hypothetical protein